MTERPSPERLAEIRERAKFWDFSRHVDAAEAMMLLLAEIDALRAERDAAYERGRADERNRCARLASAAADLAREANRKKAAAELDMLARDVSG